MDVVPHRRFTATEHLSLPMPASSTAVADTADPLAIYSSRWQTALPHPLLAVGVRAALPVASQFPCPVPLPVATIPRRH